MTEAVLSVLHDTFAFAHSAVLTVEPGEGGERDGRDIGHRLRAIKQGKRQACFTQGKVARERLHVHLEQEYATYVRDFAVLIGRAYVQCPVPAARRELAENLYEEETGGLSRGRPHAELFLEYPRGLGMDLARFEDVQL